MGRCIGTIRHSVRLNRDSHTLSRFSEALARWKTSLFLSSNLVICLAHGRFASGGRQCPHRERPARHAVDEESGIRRVLRQPGEVLRRELIGVFAHLLGEAFGVVGADLEGDDGPDVAKDGVGGLFVELGEVLVGDDQGEAVLAGLAEDGREAAGGEVLELVDVEAEVAAVGLGDVGAGHGSLLDAGDEQRSEQR